MKRYSITDAGVLTTENGNEVAFLNVAEIGLRIFRSIDQIKTDLINSGLLDARLAHSVLSVYHPSITQLLPDLIGGTLRGDITVRKRGDEYTVEEYSGVMQPTHPEYGNYAIGDVAKVENDHVRVEAFLHLRRDQAVELTVRTARESANLMAELAGFLGAPVASASKADGNAVAEASADIPDDVLAESGVDTKPTEEPASAETKE